VKHFAGQVVYTSENFLDKNNDSLHNDLQQLLYVSKRRFISNLFPVQEEDQKGFQISRRFKSVSSRFASQLEQLMSVLGKTTSHFIRCIKPNEMQMAEVFNANSVMTQLRYNGNYW
jgi:myosin heavy subunit